MFAVLALILIPAALGLLALETIRSATDGKSYTGFEPTYRAYGA